MTSIFDARELNERLFFSRRDTSPTPSHAVELEVPGAAVLHVRWHRRRDDAPTLLLFHGNGEVVADYDASASTFADVGVNLAVMDFRGYGRSAGSPTLRSLMDDAHRVVQLVGATAANGRGLFVMGRSLGSACAAELYGGSPANVSGFILESGFVDLDGLIRRRGMQPPPEISAEERRVFDPLPKLARGQRPLLVLHGAEDTLIAADEGRRAHDAAGTPDKELVVVPERGHNDLSLSPDYWDALAAFVARLASRTT